MAKKRTPRVSSAAQAVTAERARRLCHLLRLLADGPQTRALLIRRLGLNVRGFYRDLELLRAAGITLLLEGRRYALQERVEDAVDRLPLPDPHLTLGEARALSRGRSRAHRKLRDQLTRIVQ
jgi:hypothetical protein